MFCGSLPLSVPGFVRSLFMGEREGGHLMAFALSFPRVDSAQPRERPTNPTYVYKVTAPENRRQEKPRIAAFITKRFLISFSPQEEDDGGAAGPAGGRPAEGQ